jgi:hypothetical protein
VDVGFPTNHREIEAMSNEVRGLLPIKIDSTSNGEFRPVPLTDHVARANSEAETQIGENAKRVGLGRRAFARLASNCVLVEMTHFLHLVFWSFGLLANRITSNYSR